MGRFPFLPSRGGAALRRPRREAWAHPALPRLAHGDGGEDALLGPAKFASSLPFQTRRDPREPGVAALGAWPETGARRPALPCGGEFCRVPVGSAPEALPRHSQELPNRAAANGSFPPCPIQVAAAGGCDSGAPGPERPGGKSWLACTGFDSRAPECGTPSGLDRRQFVRVLLVVCVCVCFVSVCTPTQPRF